MSLSVSLLLLVGQEVSVDGLQPGERHRSVAGPVDLAGHVDGRVVDALSGLPVPGASVESWTEEIDRLHGGFHRVDATRTGADGRFLINVGSADKGRVRAPGYLALSTTATELAGIVELFPAQAEPVRLRFVDSDERAIAGARITTTYSCEHDVPAFEARSDALGEVALFEYGLQACVPELRVLAPGFAGIRYLEVTGVLAPRETPWTVHLPRRRGISLRVLAEDGVPLANAPLVALDAGDHQVLVTDDEGRVRLDSRYGRGELSIEELAPARRVGFLSGGLDASVVRLGGERWPEDTPTGELVLTVAEDVGVVDLEHADGWHASRRDRSRPIAFPAGDVSVVLGGDFEELERMVVDVSLSADETRVLALEPVRAAEVTLKLPEGVLECWLEAEGESLVNPAAGPLFVPRGRNLRAFARTASAIHRLEVGEAVDGLVLDLADPATTSRTFGPPGEGEAIVVVEAAHEGELELLSPGDAASATRIDGSNRFRITGPRGTPFVARWHAPGCATTGVRGVLDDGSTHTIPTVPLARLTLEAEGSAVPLEAAALDLEALHPGPLQLTVQLADGTFVGLELVLAPGEERRLLVSHR